MARLELLSGWLPFASDRPFLFFLLLAPVLVIGYYLAHAVYNVYFHPLAKYPGPALWAASQIPYALAFSSGHGHRTVRSLHRKYGETIRIAPDRLSFSTPEAWKEIMGHQKGGGKENPKAPNYYDPLSIPGTDGKNHSRQRRLLSVGFSAQFIKEQQAVINQYVDLLMDQLRKLGEGGSNPLDMVTWFNCTTFDIVGDLAFGQPLGSLRNGSYHPWVSLIFVHVKLGTYMYSIAQLPLLAKLIKACIPKSMTTQVEQHHALTKQLVDTRRATDTARLDLMHAMSRTPGGLSMSIEEIYSNTGTLVVAGSETTATALSGHLYHLLKTPAALKKATDEVRSGFESEDEINYASVERLTYLDACIREALRIYPAVPSTVPRITPPEGNMIFGEYVPPGTILDIWQWPMSTNEEYFQDANKFIPERWLGDAAYDRDQKEASQPFSLGPRDCLGRNLAYGEMRIILARLLWNFDMRLAEESKNWGENQEVYIVWFKPPLRVHLTPRN
ncbi:isotrichodermin C-15 hydroxylase [Colletotrichum zoysiae]|uniref:Isotrichodermin C-15 hydroxylase n=1 Tax=Colletotrichum zoysiae TaxID=1216348 RepID=A0AAD9LX39_9PEZI|nr:isotrichodermin C-15 hydroxylase [Colletotrichum zoysiae]